MVDLEQDWTVFSSLVLQLREMCMYVPGTVVPLVWVHFVIKAE